MSTFYKLGDILRIKEREEFGLSMDAARIAVNTRCDGIQIKAEATGEKRCPKKGEWYLSGAKPVAWRAPNDLSTAYYIATPVKVIQTTTVQHRKIV